MKGLLIIPLVLLSLMPQASWGGEIGGRYICEMNYKDGSSVEFIIDVADLRLSQQYIKHDIKRDYKQIFKSPDFGTTVFASDPAFLILSRTDRHDVVEINRYNFIDGAEDEFIRGSCERAYIN